MNFDVGIIGAGIAGIHSAIELSDLGYSVILIEKKPSIGGKASQLGKFFPTDDCALCCSVSTNLFLKGGFRRCLYRSNLEENPNITILTLADISEIKGNGAGFKIVAVKNPRYVNENCIACKACEKACPIEVENDFNFGFDNKKSIYLPFPQAIPHRYVIDKDHCKDCKTECKEACPVDAINLEDKPETLEINVKSVILALGFEEATKDDLKQIGYHDGYKNVVTQLQLARLLDPTGPTKGEIINPETGEKASKVTIGLCSGSRDRRFKEYCSKICCTYSLKHALMLLDRGVEVKICYMDIRTFGEYEDYYLKSRSRGVTFLRGRISNFEQDPITKKMIVNIENTLDSQTMELEEDLLVLTPPIIPATNAIKYAKMCGVNTDENGFLLGNTQTFSLTETNVKGVFIAGTIEGPKDIPDTISQADSAAIKVNNYLKGDS